MNSRDQFEAWAKIKGLGLYADGGWYYDIEASTAYHAWQASREAVEAEIAALKAKAFVPVSWQFFQDGEWWNGDDRIRDHRKNTVAAGQPVRDLYAAPEVSYD